MAEVTEPVAQGSHQIEMMPVERLILDRQNPRLGILGAPNTERELLKQFWTYQSVEELTLSISANGYFQEEPLFVIPDDSQISNTEESKYIVVEGNRRLAAVKILLDDGLRRELNITTVEPLDEAQKSGLRKLPVSMYPNREVLWTYLSFRHINAPLQWDAFSKAKFVAHIHDDYNISLDEIARRTGDQNATVRRLYRGYKVLMQAEEQVSFSIEDGTKNKFYFSHLYTILNYSETQEFLGIRDGLFADENPIPENRLTELGELMVWLYGKKSENKQSVVRSQNPDLRHLNEVIGNSSALAALRSGLTLNSSFDITVGDSEKFRTSLFQAREHLKQAVATVATGYSGGDNLFAQASDIQELAKTLNREMRLKNTRTSSVRSR